MNLTICCFCLLVSVCYAQQDTQDAGLCKTIDIVLVQNVSTGMRIILTSITENPSNHSIDLPQLYLPPECNGTNRLCNILRFEYNGIVYHIIPSIRTLVVMSYAINSVNGSGLHVSQLSIAENCNPTSSFYTGQEGGYRIFVACLDLRSRPTGSLRYLEYYFSPSSGSILRNTEAVAVTETIYGPETVSKVILVRNQHRCLHTDNLYFIDDSFVLHYPADYRAFDFEFEESNGGLQNCDRVESVENYRDDNLLIRCSNGQVVLYDTCISVYSYLSQDHVPYPCTNWDTVIYRNDSNLRLERRGSSSENEQDINLPSGNLTYGACVGEETPTFVGTDSHGETFIAHFSDGVSDKVTRITSQVFDVNDTELSYQPVFSDDRDVFGVYDMNTKEFLIVNLTSECMTQPIILRMNMSAIDLVPSDLLLLHTGKGSYNCNCHDTFHVAPYPEGTTDTTTHATVYSTSTHATVYSNTTSAVGDTVTDTDVEMNSGKRKEKTRVVWWYIFTPVLFVLFAVFGLVAIAAAVGCYLYKKRCGMQLLRRISLAQDYQECKPGCSGKVYIGTDHLIRSDSFSVPSVVVTYNNREQQRDDLNLKMQEFRNQGT